MIRRFGQIASIPSANPASNDLRTKLRPFHRNRFFAVCWVMVLAPRKPWPARYSASALRMALKSTP